MDIDQGAAIGSQGIAAEGFDRSEHTAHEEFIHALSHGVGFIASLVGLFALLFAAHSQGTASHMIGAGIFGTSLIILYGTSALYHGLSESRAKEVMRVLDHVAIYFLIAGTYTPFLLIASIDAKGNGFLVLIWALSGLGIVLELFWKRAARRVSLILYLTMGWIGVFTLEPLVSTLGQTGLVLLVLGGLAYTLGVVFYVWKTLPYNHAVWHGFVLGGSALHFSCVLGFLIP